MIERVWFKNFRALRAVEVGLTPLTVIVGPNSSGKTSVLEGTYGIVQLAEKKLFDVLDIERIRSVGSTGPMELGAEGRWDGLTGNLTLSVELETNKANMETFKTRLVARWGKQVADIERAEIPTRWLEAQRLHNAFGVALFLRLSPRQLAAPSYVEEEVPAVRPDGKGLASVLNDLASSAPEAMAAVQEALQGVVPSIRRVRTERAAVRRTETEHIVVDGQSLPRTREREYWGHRVVLDTTSGAGIPIDAASEGTVLTLGLLTVLYGRNPPRVLLLDDIDRALHPKAQEDLVAQLRKILAARPELQIVATSHSPYLLDALRFEEVRLTTLRDDGSVACAPLTDHPEYERWKDHVKPGELWTSAAETWVAARPERAP